MPEDETEPAPRGALALLRRGPFARYAAGEAVSMTGTWMQVMAQGWVMTGLTERALWLGLVSFAQSIPMLALTMWGGSLADRYDKRKILLATQVVQIILAALVGWLVLTGRVQIWHILVVSFTLGISASFEMPSASALVPELVAKAEIAKAVAIDRSIFHGTRFIGPALGGVVIGLWGTAAAFFANSLSFLALMAALVSIHPRARGTPEEEQERAGGMKAGIAYVRSDPPTMAMLALMSIASLFVFPIIAVMMPLYSRLVMGFGPDKMGYLMGVSGIGSLSGSLLLLNVPRARRVVCMMGAAGVVVACLLALSAAHGFLTAAAAMILLTTCTSLTFGLANTTVQERAPGPLRGRVSALAALSFVGMMPIASLGMPELADLTGIRTTIAVAALAYGVGAAFVLGGAGRHSTELPARVVAAVPVEAVREEPA